jgi:deoxyribodipyrimidine photolyase
LFDPRQTLSRLNIPLILVREEPERFLPGLAGRVGAAAIYHQAECTQEENAVIQAVHENILTYKETRNGLTGTEYSSKLKETGWMSNRGRQNVASCFAKLWDSTGGSARPGLNRN